MYMYSINMECIYCYTIITVFAEESKAENVNAYAAASVYLCTLLRRDMSGVCREVVIESFQEVRAHK